jgi:thioredoxin-like negative regulator of GroEL
MPSCNWAFGCAIGLFVITLIIVLIIVLGGTDDNKEKIIVMPTPAPAPTPAPTPAPGPTPAKMAAPTSGSSGARAVSSRAHIRELSSAKEAAALLKASQPALVLFYADFCGHCKQMMPDFEQAAEEASSKTGVIIAKIESGKLKDMASVSSQLPAINGFPTMCTNYEGNGIQAHVGRKDRAAIQAVIQKASAVRMAARANMAMGKIAARQMIEFASMQDACAALKGKNKAVVMAYADWCGHCKAMKADYESLVDKAPAGVMVGRLNSNAIKPGQMCEGVEEIKAFPTILYNNGSKIVKVMGRQSLQALMDLLKK